MTEKCSVAVLYGGRSAEHDVSILSASNVLRALDPTKYTPVPIGITHDGRWFLQDHREASLTVDSSSARTEVALLPGGIGRLITPRAGISPVDLPRIDVVFPVLHGPFGEDGSVQGYAEIAGVAYVGCGILSSAVCLDKDMAKRVLAAAGVPVARSSTIKRGDMTDFVDIKRRLGSPVFVKPARQGSSVGVGKAIDARSFAAAVESAFRHDDTLLVEEFIEAREIECAVLEKADGSLVVSDPGEISMGGAHQFYSYEAKYLDPDGAVVKAPADVPASVAAAARILAADVFRTLGCAGMARVDFFLKPDNRLIVNEVNTIPGFTDISMYAKALAVGGIGYGDLLDILIEHARERHRTANG